MDLSDMGSSESEERNSGGGAQSPDRVSTQIKTCADCGTTKTPLWRGGPAGPKSLCNACGIRSRKKRRALLGLNKEKEKEKKTKKSGGGGGGGGGEGSQAGLKGWGREVGLRRPRSPSMAVGRQWRKLREEEQAAFLLMALSCGSVFA